VPYTREQGIQAVIDLQKIGGIKESREDAEKGWDAMSPHQQKVTEETHFYIFGGPNDA
jgi:hypothetical protein